MFEYLTHLIVDGAGSTALLSLTIVVCALVLEDLTSVLLGMFAAEGIIGIPLALSSLLVGIVLGDTTLYSLGRFARTHPRLSHYIDHDFTASFRTWLERQYRLLVFSAHFVPGLRFTTYIASGFFKRPLREFVPMAIAGGVVLGSGLFALAYWFGSVTGAWMRPVRYVVALGFVLVLVVVTQKNLRRLRALDLPNTDDGIRAK
jgi:membrane protein DedA with SNARE-associated domain